MIRAYDITFQPAGSPIREPITKFGGQPVWLREPVWPLSKQTGEQMTFICQIQLYPELFGKPYGQMAYIFMTDVKNVALATWDSEAGENAVVVQPGRPLRLQTRAIAAGPTLYELIEIPELGELQPKPAEYAVSVKKRTDPAFINMAERTGLDDPSFERYSKACEGNKFGGTPLFFQEDAFPPGRQLLLQLDSTQVPFAVNFGDCGVAWAFISPDGSAGKFLWQCY